MGVPQWRSQTDKQTSRNKTIFFLSFNIYINKRNDCILQKNILIPSCNGVMETFNLKTHKKGVSCVPALILTGKYNKMGLLTI